MEIKIEHVECGGEVDTHSRKCLKCKKKWNRLAFLFTTSELRPMRDALGKVLMAAKVSREPTSYAKWGNRLPGVGAVAGRLPNWPRWLRVLTSLVVVGAVVALVLYLT